MTDERTAARATEQAAGPGAGPSSGWGSGRPVGSAVVLGGSIAGLLAASVLAERSIEVTIIDRDELAVDAPRVFEARRGVPQGEQTHHLLALGAARLEELLPGLESELIAEGCTKRDDLADAIRWQGESWRARVTSELRPVCFTRPVLEGVIRRRVLALPGVRAVQGAASGLILSDDGSTVIGAEVKGGRVADELPDGRALGDIVIDASGRSTRTPQWLEALGFDRPTTSTAWVHMGYTCYRVRLAEGALPEGVSTILSPPASVTASSDGSASPDGSASSDGSPIAVHLRDVGRGEHMVIAYGVGRNYPPTDVEAILEIAEQLPTPLIARALRGAEQLSEPASSRAASDHRLLWEQSLNQPEGLIHIGDAAAAYNPSSGQGMTMAAVAATVLRDLLATEALEAAAPMPDVLRSTGFARRFQSALSPHLDDAWQAVVRADARVPGAKLENVELPEPLTPELLAAAASLQAVDPAFALEAARATHWIRPDWIYEKPVRDRLEAWIAAGREVPGHRTDPRDVPEAIEAIEAADAATVGR